MRKQVKILFVCTGNICRSPMAEALFNHHVKRMNLDDHLFCESCGIYGYHQGAGADPRAIAMLKQHNIKCDGLISRPMKGDDYIDFDRLIAMDHTHQAFMQRSFPIGIEPDIRLMLSYTSGGDVPDPYYDSDGSFKLVYDMLEASVLALIQSIIDVE